MIRKFLSLMTATLIAVVFLSSGSYAQTLSPLEECIAGFYSALDAWDSDVHVKTGYSRCETTKGRMHVHLQGSDSTLAYYWNFNARLYKAADKSKWCSIAVSRHPDIGGNYEGTFIELAGRDASQWNRFLKRDGCADALNKLP